jgi:hypothetical protein
MSHNLHQVSNLSKG